MAGKPMSMAALLQEKLPKQQQPKGINTKNRFDVLRDRSASAASGRGESVKRPRIESPERVDRNLAFKSMADEEEKFKAARAIVDKVRSGLVLAKEQGMNGPLLTVLGGIVEWMDITTGVQETTANVVVDSFNKVASPSRLSRKDSQRRKEVPEISEEEAARAARKKKFVQEVKDAERSSLYFKTDMGPVPVLNPETMKRKFTESIAAKAAAEEKNDDGRPSAAVAAQLDDALDMVTRMEFFGKVTKKAAKKGGGEENFCTIPVRLCFKDKETREAADGRLRSLCKMGGTIPYHRTLRNVISSVIEVNKASYPNSYIQVKVDAENMKLKVSRRTAGVWHNNIETVDLPESVLDLSRHGPKSSNKEKEQQSRTDADMEVADSEQQQG
jgi:hypothetical protein